MQKKSSKLQDNQKQGRANWRLSSHGQDSEDRTFFEFLIDKQVKSENFRIGMALFLGARRYYLKKIDIFILSHFNNGKEVSK